MDEVLWFLGECWKDLGIPEQVSVRQRPRVVRLGVGGADPVARDPVLPALWRRAGLIPKGEPQFNGGVENFNGWFQPRLFDRRHQAGRPARELARLQEAVNTQHVHPRFGGQTPAQHRRGLRLRKLPASFVVPTGRLKLAAGV